MSESTFFVAVAGIDVAVGSVAALLAQRRVVAPSMSFILSLLLSIAFNSLLVAVGCLLNGYDVGRTFGWVLMYLPAVAFLSIGSVLTAIVIEAALSRRSESKPIVDDALARQTPVNSTAAHPSRFASGPQPNLIAIRTADLDRAACFYQALGLRFQRERHGNGPEHLATMTHKWVFEIYPLGKSGSTSGTVVGFQVESIADCVAAAEKNGGEVVLPPGDGPWGKRAVLRDPDGHRVELTQTPVWKDATGDSKAVQQA